jgi:hypothetical protein
LGAVEAPPLLWVCSHFLSAFQATTILVCFQCCASSLGLHCAIQESLGTNHNILFSSSGRQWLSQNSQPDRSDSAHFGLSSHHSGLTSAYTTTDWLSGNSRINRASPQRLAGYKRCKKIIELEPSHLMKSGKSGVCASSNQPQILPLTLPILLEAWIFHPVQLFLSIYLFHPLLQSSGKCS